MLSYVIFNTDMGWVGILASANGLLGITLPQPTTQQALRLLGDGINEANNQPTLFKDLTERLKAYFSGYKMDFPDKLDLSGATYFQRRAWGTARLIPYGETRSYRWVAEQIGQPGAARAVGQALGKNRLPVIIPCHRVVASNGSPGGFSGGLEMKQYLLRLEMPGNS